MVIFLVENFLWEEQTFASSTHSSIGCANYGKVFSLSDSIHQASDGSLVTRDATLIQKILESYQDSGKLESDNLSEDLVVSSPSKTLFRLGVSFMFL